MKTEEKTRINTPPKLFTEHDMIECYTTAVINTTRALLVNTNVNITAEDYVKSLLKNQK